MSDSDTHLGRFGRLLPRDLLKAGERVVYAQRPSPWYIILGALGGLLVIALITVIVAALLMLTPWTGGSAWIAWLVGGVVFVARLIWQALRWWTHVYILTDHRVLRRLGVLSLSIYEADRCRIQQTQLDASLLERIFGVGTIAFATAGSDTYDAFWIMVGHPHEVNRLIRQKVAGDGL